MPTVLTEEENLRLYECMATIRQFESRVSVLYRDGEIPGFVHVSLGQEAVATGACWPLRTSDFITSNHRGHGHCIAKGLGLEGMFAELLGKREGICGGLGGSMHIADPALGILGANGIVGAGLPIAGGAALAALLGGAGQVVIAFFGDGAVAQGAFHETLNTAALWKLPAIFLCENNHYSEFTRTEMQHPVPIVERAMAYGIEGVQVDGNDVQAVALTMSSLVSRARVGEGPFLVEAQTYRWHGHYEGDGQRYRPADEVANWQESDPLLLQRLRMIGESTPEAVIDEIDAKVAAKVHEALAGARAGSLPPEDAPRRALLSPSGPPSPPDEFEPMPDAQEWRTMDALNAALAKEMTEDPSVFLAGIDIGRGNVFAVTRGLYDRWPDRVLDTPISETAICGLAVGSAMAGMKPVVEIMYLDFIGVCFDQILNQAAKLRFMTGGRAPMSLVIRTQFGAGRSSAGQHSQSLEAVLAHIPGLKVVMPSTPADAYGLLRASIHDPNPVVFIENRLLYGAKGPRPPDDYIVPLGKARIVRPGRDVTVVSVSRMVWEAVAAADTLVQEGIEAEVIDLQTVSPLDRETILQSVERTSRVVIAHEAVRDFGIGAEIAACLAEQGFWLLDAPIMRVGADFTPAPYSPSLERNWLPQQTDIATAIRRCVRS